MAAFSFKMGKVRDIANRLKTFDINQELDEILLDIQNVITGMNKEQLSIGEDSMGNKLDAYQDPFYALYKKDILDSQAPLGIPDLKLTGDFYNGFTIQLSNTALTITSTDIKTLQLEGKYGDIFGLQPEKISELAFRYILPQLAMRFKRKVLQQ